VRFLRVADFRMARCGDASETWSQRIGQDWPARTLIEVMCPAAASAPGGTPLLHFRQRELARRALLLESLSLEHASVRNSLAGPAVRARLAFPRGSPTSACSTRIDTPPARPSAHSSGPPPFRPSLRPEPPARSVAPAAAVRPAHCRESLSNPLLPLSESPGTP
jgi:hypothetical protein